MEAQDDVDMPDFDEEAVEEVPQQPQQIDIESEMEAVMQQYNDTHPAPEQRCLSYAAKQQEIVN